LQTYKFTLEVNSISLNVSLCCIFNFTTITSDSIGTSGPSRYC